MNFKKFIIEYFTFNKSERKGLLLLGSILLLMIFIRVGIKFMSPASEAFDIAMYEKQIRDFEASMDTVKNDGKPYKPFQKNYLTNEFPDKTKSLNQPFNPNNQSIERWVEIGLSPKQAGVIKNYESKGGKFRKKEDVKKMFVINDKIYQKLEPWLVFDEAEQKNNYPGQTTENQSQTTVIKEKILVDINTSDTIEFTQVKGIGPAFARRIVKFREKLGGFHSKTQLMDVFGITPEVYQTIENQITITPKALTKININYCTYDELTKFPYFSFKQAKEIIKYREKNGFFKSVEELQTKDLVTEDLYVKIAPYFEASK